MIKIEIVQRIIDDNNKSMRETEELRDSTSTYQWSDSRIELANYISNLSDDDFCDLFALIEYGRDVFDMKKQTFYSDFLQKRTSMCCNLSKDEKHQKAEYFLKMQNLSKYLSSILMLLDETEFKF